MGRACLRHELIWVRVADWSEVVSEERKEPRPGLTGHCSVGVKDARTRSEPANVSEKEAFDYSPGKGSGELQYQSVQSLRSKMAIRTNLQFRKGDCCPKAGHCEAICSTTSQDAVFTVGRQGLQIIERPNAVDSEVSESDQRGSGDAPMLAPSGPKR